MSGLDGIVYLSEAVEYSHSSYEAKVCLGRKSRARLHMPASSEASEQLAYCPACGGRAFRRLSWIAP